MPPPSRTASPNRPCRNSRQRVVDFLTFPLRALALFERDRWGLSSLRSERFDYVAQAVQGHCLDIGCGRHDQFIREYCRGNGIGIDIFPYDGLTEENLVPDLTRLPFPDDTFDSVTFIANLNHAPRSQRDAELADAFRCLKPGGNIIVTMGNPLAEIAVHKLVSFYDRFFHTRVDVDSERGMHEEEEYYLKDTEILQRLWRAGFRRAAKRWFWTQWGFNHLFVGWKPKVDSR